MSSSEYDDPDVFAAKAFIHDRTGEHWWCDGGDPGLAAASESRVCLICDKLEVFRGPGY